MSCSLLCEIDILIFLAATIVVVSYIN